MEKYSILAYVIEYEDDDFNSETFTEYNISNGYIKEYNISKDSRNRNFNIHQILLKESSVLEGTSEFSSGVFLKIENKTLKFKIDIIDLEQDNLIIKSNTFVIFESQRYLEDNLTILKLNMVSDLVINELNSFDISLKLLEKNDGVTQFGDAYALLLNICNEYSYKYSQDISVYITDYCKNTFNYSPIRIPSNINNINIFDYVLNNYNPYILKPYIILDDFHFDDIKENKKYNLNVGNLCLLKENIHKNTDHLLLSKIFVKSDNIFDPNEFNEELRSTIIIENKTYDIIQELKPSDSSKMNDKIKILSINEDDKFIVKKMKLKHKMLNSLCSFNTFKFETLHLDDILFNRVYNVTNNKDYNDYPIVIDYKFSNDEGYFKLSGNVIFATVSNDLNIQE